MPEKAPTLKEEGACWLHAVSTQKAAYSNPAASERQRRSLSQKKGEIGDGERPVVA